MKFSDLKQYFELHCKPSAQSPEGQKLGAEYEVLVVIPDKCDAFGKKYLPIQFSKKGGVSELLKRYKEQGKSDGIDWTEKYENENLIGLQNNSLSSITVEPGGQIELSDEPHDNLEQIESSFRRFIKSIKESIRHFDGRLLFLGAQPLFEISQIPLSPKNRYQIMYPHMMKMGSHGQWMMKATAGNQLSIDYSSIEDLERKFRVICRLSPFITAIFSNSPIHRGKLSGFKSFRNYIWQNTDPTRCGIPESFTSSQFRVDDYINWALQASPYHLPNYSPSQRVIDHSFKTLIEENPFGEKVVFEDWKDHLAMLFPEIRIKNIIEIRSMDTLNPDDVLAVPNFLKTLIYDESVFEKIETMLMDLPNEEFQWYQQVAARDGLEGKVNNVDFKKLAITLMEKALESTPPEEICRLRNFFDLYTRHGLSPADLVIDRFYKAGEDPHDWIQSELRFSEDKESSFIDYPCDFLNKAMNSFVH